MFMNKFSLDDVFTQIKDYGIPVAIGQFNNCHVKGIKIQESLPWHYHDDKDKFILVGYGQLKILLPDQEIVLMANDSLIIPQGVAHAAIAEPEAWVLLID
jgi:mannose-6-phosphate isomerase-like protein (cupin superfamily)